VDETLRIVRHNGEEFLFVDFPVLVEIELIYHRLSDNKKEAMSTRFVKGNGMTGNDAGSVIQSVGYCQVRTPRTQMK